MLFSLCESLPMSLSLSRSLSLSPWSDLADAPKCLLSSDVAHEKTRPSSGLGYQVKVPNKNEVFPLRSGSHRCVTPVFKMILPNRFAGAKCGSQGDYPEKENKVKKRRTEYTARRDILRMSTG